MGKKKAFIDKKHAVTYNLIYRSTEDAEDAPPERVLADPRVGIGRPDAEAAAQQAAAHAAEGRRWAGLLRRWLLRCAPFPRSGCSQVQP